MNDRSIDWLSQAKDDLSWARDTLQSAHYAQACFVCQQSAEKAIKAFALLRGHDQIKSHSILEIADALGINDELRSIGQRLDQYYISTRYPDAFPTGSPSQYFTKNQAIEALDFAERFVSRIASLFEENNG
jgi:HEPN domain-containing protein